MSAPVTAVVLAAGSGTRMKSAKAKVLHEIGGRSLIAHALHALKAVDPTEIIVVVGHQGDEVAEHMDQIGFPVSVAVQENLIGTADAVRSAIAGRNPSGTVLITYGDVPLLTGETLRNLLADHNGRALTILSAEVPDPFGYGRIVRDEAGNVLEIREERDADENIKCITEINSGIMAIDAAFLTSALPKINNNNSQNEFYLTDIVRIAVGEGLAVGAYVLSDFIQTEGVNDRSQLANLGSELNRRICRHWMLAGVTIVDPSSTWIDSDVTIGADTTIAPNTQLLRSTTIGSAAKIGPDTTLTNVSVGDEASVIRTHAVDSKIGSRANVGPFSYLRPGTEIEAGAKIGTFVEVKNSHISKDAKVPHLSYVGDAEVGEGANIGAGTIFANYDGQEKNRTVVGKQARTGSDNVFIAPVEIGDGAYTAAGSTIREDVPPGALAHNEAPQRNILGWVAKKRPGSAADQAAKDATDD